MFYRAEILLFVNEQRHEKEIKAYLIKVICVKLLFHIILSRSPVAESLKCVENMFSLKQEKKHFKSLNFAEQCHC